MKTETQSVLSAKNICKSFQSPSSISLLENVGLELFPAQSVAICGSSGVGKTTLLSILAALQKPDAGQLYWGVHCINTMPLNQQRQLRAKHIGFVFQSSQLVGELNVLENVLLSARISGVLNSEVREQAGVLLEKLGLQERQKHLPEQLSGGERQRVALARALITAPEVIFADEPTGRLDEQSAKNVMDLLLRLCKDSKVALLLVTHDPKVAAGADLVLELRQARLLQRS